MFTKTLLAAAALAALMASPAQACVNCGIKFNGPQFNGVAWNGPVIQGIKQNGVAFGDALQSGARVIAIEF